MPTEAAAAQKGPVWSPRRTKMATTEDGDDVDPPTVSLLSSLSSLTLSLSSLRRRSCSLVHLFYLLAWLETSVQIVHSFSIPACQERKNLHKQKWTVPTYVNIVVGSACATTTTTTQLCAKALKVTSIPWYPLPLSSANEDKEDYEYIQKRRKIEEQAVLFAARLVHRRLQEQRSTSSSSSSSFLDTNVGQLDDHSNVASKIPTSISNINSNHEKQSNDKSPRIQALVENRFMDLTCTEEGERILEDLFFSEPLVDPKDNDHDDDDHDDDDHVIRGAVMVLQSLCVFATQVGVKGPPEQLRRLVSHLDPRWDPSLVDRDLLHLWDSDSVRRLKYQINRVPALQLLAALKRKRTTQGAFDLLVDLGAWEVHEDLALLRSGFPLRFSKKELEAAHHAAASAVQPQIADPEEILGIRRDLRHLKVYTIDGVSTDEIDDGLSVEKFTRVNQETRQPGEEETAYRVWIHIADAERLAPPGSDMFEIGRKRITSLYLPRAYIFMFPPLISTELMSLRTNQDAHALSLGVEIRPDGSIDESSIQIVPSLIRVTYRLSYDDVDEMLAEGIGYAEEWELGVLVDVATARREYRIRNGSSEGHIPNPIPYSVVTTYPDKNAPDGIGISVKVEVSHNAGRNQTLENGLSTASSNRVLDNAVPSSSASLLVTETMIVAGEAIGRWKLKSEKEEIARVVESDCNPQQVKLPNRLRLPFRTQPPPDYRSRASEKRIMINLFEYNVGDGLCYSWYARRFLLPVKVSEIAFPHSGMGLDCYVQWTSPIRRYSDLQVHSAVKRFLRRQRLNQLIKDGSPFPQNLKPRDLGIPSRIWDVYRDSGKFFCNEDDLDQDLNYLEGLGLIGASRVLQKESQQYWLFQHIERLFQRDSDHTFQAVVLGCVDPEKQQYAIYVYELGLEYRFLSTTGQLDPGTRLRLKVQSVAPRHGLLSFVRVG